MNGSFLLNIFPAGSLSLTVITTVWIGVWVVVFFNLRLGWVLSGLVVPGYLVPLILIKPWAALVIVAEGAITYLCVWLYSEKFSRFAGLTIFFGRDRFFALLLVSVLVRIVFDILLLPALGEYLNRLFQLNFDYLGNLHSFGLIVVALIANQFWKPGIRRGLFVLLVTVALTAFIVRYILMAFTNFDIGTLAYMYENIAASMLASPKAYIVLLTTAFIASHLNLRYGWEYSGILIPALLALEWYEPFKLFITFSETFIILILASLLLKIPLFQRTTMEGARKLLFFFNVSFFYKFCLAHLIVNFFPRYLVSDFFGFGYLLSTLLAVKMHDKEIAIRMTRAALQTSFMAMLVATGVGFGLTYLPNIMKSTVLPERLDQGKTLEKFNGNLADILRREEVQMYRSIRKNSVPVPQAREIEIFREALKVLQKWQKNKNREQLWEAQNLLSMVQYSPTIVNDRYLILREEQEKRGWGVFILDLKPKTDLQIQVPEPINEWATIYSGLALLKTFSGSSMAIAGSRRNANEDGSADVLGSSTSFFSTFQQTLAPQGILQVRGLTTKMRNILGKTGDSSQADLLNRSFLMISSDLPDGLKLKHLNETISNFVIRWAPPPMNNVLRETGSSKFAELFLTRQDRRSLLFKPYFDVASVSSTNSVQSIVGYLQDWLLTRKGALAPKGSEAYRKPTLEELLFLDREILTPLTKFLSSGRPLNEWSEEQIQELQVLKNSLGLFGYDLQHYHHKVSGHDYLIVAEDGEAANRRYWGTYIFRLGESDGTIIQVPRPLSERNVFEYAVSLFENLKSRALLISGTHPFANSDGSSDVIKLANKENVFNLVNQVLLREAEDTPQLIIQCRAFAGDRELSRPDAMIAAYTGISVGTLPSAKITHLLEILEERYHFTVGLIHGEKEEAGYEVGGIPQAMYLGQARNKEFVNLWLSPTTRAAFRQQTESKPMEDQFLALHIETVTEDLYNYLVSAPIPSSPPPSSDLSQLEKDLADYVYSQDIIALDSLLVSWPNLKFTRVIDVNSKQAFLVALDGNNAPLLVANLKPLHSKGSYYLHPRINREEVSRYIDSRSLWLRLKEKK